MARRGLVDALERDLFAGGMDDDELASQLSSALLGGDGGGCVSAVNYW